MNLIVLILRFLFGLLAPSWRETGWMAVRRDGRLHGWSPRELEPEIAPVHVRGRLSSVWGALLRAVRAVVRPFRGRKTNRGGRAV